MKLKRLLAYTVAIIMIGTVFAIPAVSDSETRYEFENGTLTNNPEIYTGTSGYSGTGAVIIKESNQTAAVTVNVPTTGMYEIFLGCIGVGGSKILNLNVNGVSAAAVSTPDSVFGEISAALTKLNAGDNVISVSANWTWFAADYVRVAPATLPKLNATSQTCNPNATAETKSLMAYLGSVYGKNILSGQQEDCGSAAANNSEFKYLLENTGELPAIRGFDFLNYNPLFGYEDGTTQRIIAWVNGAEAAKSSNGATYDPTYYTGNGIATACIHMNVPKDFTNYKLGDTMNYQACSFYVYDQSSQEDKDNKNSWLKGWSTANAVKSGTKENQFYLLSLDDIAEQLKILQDKNVPVILRPLHEAEGSGGANGDGAWFWWGSAGAEVYKELWILTYDYLTKTKGLNNLIWEYNSYNYSESAQWYPGDEYVDIVAFDKYNCSGWNDMNLSAITSTFYGLIKVTGGNKIVAMAENDSIPAVDSLIEESAGWLYFCPWYQNYLTHYCGELDNNVSLKKMYQSEYCITLDELPDWKTFPIGNNPITNPTTLTSTTITSSDTTPTIVVLPKCGDINEDDDINTADLIYLAKFLTGRIPALTNAQQYAANVNLISPGIDGDDLLTLIKYFTGSVNELPIK